jgi:GNAT superfamily N-acetyltransferase
MPDAGRNIVIRSAQPADIPGLCDLLAELFAIESNFTPNCEKQVQGLTLLITGASGSAVVFVAEMDGKVIGMASVQTLISTAEGGRVGLVEDVIVDGRFRSKGIGARLLDQIIAWSRNKELKRLQLLADRANLSAVNFYIRHGWQATDMHCMRMMLK